MRQWPAVVPASSNQSQNQDSFHHSTRGSKGWGPSSSTRMPNLVISSSERSGGGMAHVWPTHVTASTCRVHVPLPSARRLCDACSMAERIGIVPFWKSYDRKAVLRTAQLAEDLGYDSIWIPEAWAYEQFQLLTEIAVHTTRIKLANGIANVFSRSAGLLAMSVATLDEISEGRAILGLGTSG